MHCSPAELVLLLMPHWAEQPQPQLAPQERRAGEPELLRRSPAPPLQAEKLALQAVLGWSVLQAQVELLLQAVQRRLPLLLRLLLRFRLLPSLPLLLQAQRRGLQRSTQTALRHQAGSPLLAMAAV